MQHSHGKPADLETSGEAGSHSNTCGVGKGGEGTLEALTTSCLPQGTQPEHGTLSTPRQGHISGQWSSSPSLHWP